MLREKLKRHFADEIVRRGRQSGEIQEHWKGSVVTYNYTRTAKDDAEVAARVDQAMVSGETPTFHARYNELETLERTLAPAIMVLRTEGEEILGPRFGSERITVGMNGFNVPLEKLKSYLRELSLAFSVNYRILVESNFPTLRSEFKLCSRPPSSYFFILGAPAVSLFEWDLTIYSMTSKTAITTVEFVEEVIRRGTHRGAVYQIDGVEYDHATITRISVGHYLSQSDRFGDMHLRSQVYAALAKEWAAVEHAFARSSAS